jgi:1-acyl-sn-glycerol-3-phosphate acyltransferase
MFFWLLKYVLVGPWLRVLFRPWVEGVEHFPTQGAAIVASNHLSFSDSFFCPLVVGRHITFLAKDEYFTGRGIKGWFTKLFFSSVGQVPVDRSGGRASEAAIRTGLGVLNRGLVLGIYPEGTRSPNGCLYRGKTGVARMAMDGNVPVIPVAMINTFEIQPPGQTWPRLRRVGIRFGEPIWFTRYDGLENDRFVLRSATDQLMYVLMSMSGQEYVDMYAQRAKELIKAGQPLVSTVDPED